MEAAVSRFISPMTRAAHDADGFRFYKASLYIRLRRPRIFSERRPSRLGNFRRVQRNVHEPVVAATNR
jgi:hypothetical protein